MTRAATAPLAVAASYLAAGAVGGAGWAAGALSGSGALAAAAVGGTVLAAGGVPAAGTLVAFFVTSSALSRLGAARRSAVGVLAQAKGGRRDAWQVLANGAVGALCLALGGQQGRAAFLGAIASAAADTWGTELGLLAPGPPRLVTTLRPVSPGTSGAVTPQGTLAGVAGALTVGATWAALRRLTEGRDGEAGLRPGRAVLLALLAGTAGAGVDSLLGATVQGAYWCPTCAEPLEGPVHRRCGQKATLVRGWAWLDNDAVNALATAAGAAAGAACRLR